MMCAKINDDTLKKSLHNTCKLLKLAYTQNNVNIGKNIQTLLKLDSKIFEPLLN